MYGEEKRVYRLAASTITISSENSDRNTILAKFVSPMKKVIFLMWLYILKKKKEKTGFTSLPNGPFEIFFRIPKQINFVARLFRDQIYIWNYANFDIIRKILSWTWYSSKFWYFLTKFGFRFTLCNNQKIGSSPCRVNYNPKDLDDKWSRPIKSTRKSENPVIKTKQ